MLEWTGERFLPWIKESTIAYEHLHRYAYAATLVENKRVLDLASGEGYGSKILSRSASFVVGVDIDSDVVRHASQKYGSANLEFLAGSITAVPVQQDGSFDAIVCFEAIEHIDDQQALMGEVKRLLKPEGLFIVSTPNKAIYHDASDEENPFHVKELYFEEFHQLLSRYFASVQFLGQRIHPSSSIWPIGESTVNGFREFVLSRDASSQSEFEFIDEPKRVPLYFIALASAASAAVPRCGSVLVDESDGLFKEQEHERKYLERQVSERDDTIRSRDEAVRWRSEQLTQRDEQIAGLEKSIEWMQTQVGDLQKTIAGQEEGLKWRAQQVEELQTAKTFWETESASLSARLQNTQQQLAVATDTLAGIYASRGWKLIMKLRSIRDRLTGRATR